MDERPEIGDRVFAAERAVTATITAFRAQEWDRLYDFTDADTTAKLMAEYLGGKERRVNRQLPPLTWEALTPEEEEMREFARMAAERPVTFHELARIASLEEARALSSREFLARWAEARKRWELEVHSGERVVIGSVAILPDYAMVVTRYTKTGSFHPMHVLCNVGVMGDGNGIWGLDASAQWFGLMDIVINPSDDT